MHRFGSVLLLTLMCVAVWSHPAKAQHVTFAGPTGGVGGTLLQDSVFGGAYPYELRIRCGAWIDAVQIVYKDGSGTTRQGKKIGGSGGTLVTFRLQPGEYITKVLGNYGPSGRSKITLIRSIRVVTSNGRQKTWGSYDASKPYFFYAAPAGHMVYSFWGRGGWYVDALGVGFSPLP